MSSDMPYENSGRDLDTVAEGAGLRHDERVENRDLNDRLLRRATYLKPEDRVLLNNIYQHGMTQRELAALMGICSQTVSRRANRLCQRLNSEIFSFVLVNRGKWKRKRRRVAELYFLQGYALRETVARSGESMHQVRKHVQAVIESYESLRP